MFPSNEWGGCLFYRITEQNKILIEDFCLQAIGDLAYVEYDIGPTAYSYYMDNINSLNGCKIGYLHSHNTMSASFSYTDKETFCQQSKIRDEVLSVIVNNNGDANAMYSKGNKLKLVISDFWKDYPTAQNIALKQIGDNIKTLIHNDNEFNKESC